MAIFLPFAMPSCFAVTISLGSLRNSSFLSSIRVSNSLISAFICSLTAFCLFTSALILESLSKPSESLKMLFRGFREFSYVSNTPDPGTLK